MTQTRDSHGRYKADHRARNLAIGAATTIGAVAAGVAAALRFGLLDRFFPGSAEHKAPDLALDAPRPGSDGVRAPDAFRPDPTAPVSAAEREGLRPATGPAPGMTEDRGATHLQTEPVNG